MITPMVVQYLVGLCCIYNDPNAVDVILGDEVYDSAAKKERDVDVTVTVKNTRGNIEAFKAVEVKAESRPLDVTKIEQLCMKLADMRSVTTKSIFSASGYTEAAIRKAKTHSVDLYTLMPWDTPIGKDFADFDGIGTPTEFLSHFESNLLYWANYYVSVVARKGPGSFSYQTDTPIYNKSGKTHKYTPDMGSFIDKILIVSTEKLFAIEPAITILRTFPYSLSSQDSEYSVGPSWPHTHTIDVTSNEVYLKLNDTLTRIDEITVSGYLEWRKRKRNPIFYIFKNAFNQEIFAGAAIADYGANDGRMFAMIFPPKGLGIGIHRFCIPKKQRNIIKNLKIN